MGSGCDIFVPAPYAPHLQVERVKGRRCHFAHLCVQCTANEGPVTIQYKCLVPIYVFPEVKLRASSLFPKQNYNALSPNFYIHVSVCNFYTPRTDLPILLQPNRQNDPGNILVAHRHVIGLGNKDARFISEKS